MIAMVNAKMVNVMVEIPQSIKNQIINEYLDSCENKLADIVKTFGKPKVKNLNQKERFIPADRPVKSPAKTRTYPKYYCDNLVINSASDLPKGIQKVSNSYQVYHTKDGRKQHISCHTDLSEAVLSAYEYFSNLPGIEERHYRSIIDWLNL